MKNQYFGDVNDYLKYGLLRCIREATGLRLGVCWMLTPDDGRTDGEFRGYLEQPKSWSQFDPDLYDRLQDLRKPGATRTVQHVTDWKLLHDARCFNDILHDSASL